MNHEAQMIYRLRHDVDVYQLSDASLVFRRGGQVLKLESSRVIDGGALVGALESGMPAKQWHTLLRLDEPGDGNPIMASFINSGIVDVIAPEECDATLAERMHLLSDYLCGGLFSAASIKKAVENVGLNVVAPRPVYDAIASLLESCGVQSRHIEMQHHGDNRTSLVIPRDKRWAHELLVVYLLDEGPLFKSELAYELARRKAEYLPLHRDHSAPLVVGPVVTEPGPCLQCYETRLLSNMLHPEVMGMISSQGTRVLRRSCHRLTPLELNLLSAATYVMTLNHIMGVGLDPLSRKRRVLRLQSATMNVEWVTVFKDPLCAACGGASHTPGRQEFMPRERLHDASADAVEVHVSADLTQRVAD